MELVVDASDDVRARLRDLANAYARPLVHVRLLADQHVIDVDTATSRQDYVVPCGVHIEDNDDPDVWDLWDRKGVYYVERFGHFAVFSYWRFCYWAATDVSRVQFFHVASPELCGHVVLLAWFDIVSLSRQEITLILVDQSCRMPHPYEYDSLGGPFRRSKDCWHMPPTTLGMVYRKPHHHGLGNVRLEFGVRHAPFGGAPPKGAHPSPPSVPPVWTQADVAIKQISPRRFRLTPTRPMVWFDSRADFNCTALIRWNGRDLVTEKDCVRYDQYISHISHVSLHTAFETTLFAGSDEDANLAMAWNHVPGGRGHNLGVYIVLWHDIGHGSGHDQISPSNFKNMLAFVLTRRAAAARTIQHSWRACIADPAYHVCRRRLNRELLEDIAQHSLAANINESMLNTRFLHMQEPSRAPLD